MFYSSVVEHTNKCILFQCCKTNKQLIIYIDFLHVGHANNVHCLAKAVNSLAGALFTVHGPGDVEMRLKEFLAVTDFTIG